MKAPEEGEYVSVGTRMEVKQGNEVFTSVTDSKMEADGEQVKRTISRYNGEYFTCVLSVGQGFAVRKDTDQFAQLIHSMRRVNPHQSI